jgi:hypothetical protein
VHLTQSYLLANKVDVSLDVQPPVGDHVDIAGIVAIDNDRTSNRDMKLLKKPVTLDDNMGSNSVVLCLCTGTRHGGLLFGRPGHRMEAVEWRPPIR